jgi:hypothetical protein
MEGESTHNVKPNNELDSSKLLTKKDITMLFDSSAAMMLISKTGEK